MLERPKTWAIGFFVFICWIIYLANNHRQSVFFDFCKSLPYGDHGNSIIHNGQASIELVWLAVES